tara:strand:+ start:70 stop:2349 length:2280 start_codon:yes stop_codon:yes gene_type:complete
MNKKTRKLVKPRKPKISKRKTKTKTKRRYTRRRYTKKKYKRRTKKRTYRKKKQKGGNRGFSEMQITNEFLPLLQENEWYPANEAEIFLRNKNTSDLEDQKEISIACFTNFYRKSIYELVKIIDSYLGDIGDVVISGGDGLNNNLINIHRLISPDIDVKVILKGDFLNGDKWLNHYKLCVIMVENVVDYIVESLNDSDLINNYPGLPDLNSLGKSPADIRELFYNGSNLDIINKSQYFKDRLGYVKLNNDVNGKDIPIGMPWCRRTSNMKAGGQEEPYTLMNVKLIAIDLKYDRFDYFGSLAGVLDIVIAVPGHVGHVGMIPEIGYKVKEVGNLSAGCNCITLDYYMGEMVKMIKYGLRTSNKKIYKDLNRCKRLIEVGENDVKDALISEDQKLLNVIEGKIEDIDQPQKRQKEVYRLLKKNCKIVFSKIKNMVLRVPYGGGICNSSNDEIYAYYCGNLYFDKTDNFYSCDIETSLEDRSIDRIIELDYEAKTADELNALPELSKLDGGGPQSGKKNYDINTESIGKILETLNISDALSTHRGNRIVILNRDDESEYFLRLSLHDKISNRDNPNMDFEGNNLNGKRLDYEKKQSKSEGFDILCKPAFMCYTYPDSKMIATNPRTDGGVKNIEYNTRLILTNENCAMITGDIFKKLTEGITEGINGKTSDQFIKDLAQFRSFSEYEDELVPFSDISDTKLNALFIYSSIIPGLKLEKILEQKIKFNEKINGSIEDTRSKPFSYLAYHINNFYTEIENKAFN